MAKVVAYSALLLVGLVGAQLLGLFAPDAYAAVSEPVKLLTMGCLAFIMIHVGYEFDIDKSALGSYGWDYLVAATAAGFPWIMAAAYFVFVLLPPESWSSGEAWREALLIGRFASPTSAGVLFAMLAAAGLSATWVFRKARILAIFDDIDTIVFMIPLKMMMVGMRWQLGVIMIVMAALLWLGWRHLHAWRLPLSWPWVLAYAAGITLVCESIYISSKFVDEIVPIHLEVLLPAFILGCMIARPPGADPHANDAVEGHEIGPEGAQEQRVAAIVSATFMVLVGLSMPPLATLMSDSSGGAAWPGWGMVTIHVLLVTVLSNVGKMFPAFCYRSEATLRQRLAVAIGMWPRGEVGAGVLVVSLSYGVGGIPLMVGALSLALNLLLTGPIVAAVKRLAN